VTVKSVKFLLCQPGKHTEQSFLTPALGNRSGQLHDTAVLPQGKEGTVLKERWLGGPQGLAGYFREEKCLLSYDGT